ncbi:Hypothetical predicted protein [Paramuricea clavata]|uniref:Uncharacterized protein n=1 Tax=Paramuricea clavata TaxID=317549 RepID=A0A6S7FMR4_PARCT|nr:Hypothetical predicted protein [Paramuricea clavata]
MRMKVYIKFWSEIWDNGIEHNKDSEWLHEMKQGIGYLNQNDLKINEEDITKQCKKIPNWKAPGLDGVQGYWIKKITSCHQRIAEQLDEILNGKAELPQWITYGRTVLCLKDPSRGNAVDNFRPISCLPLMWKLMTGVIAESMYIFLEMNDVLPNEQKGCRRKTRGTKNQLLIDKLVLRDCKRRHTNLSMAWIDYRKAYDMVPHSWIVECMSMFKIAANVRTFVESSMENWKTELTSSGESLGNVNIRRGIFQGDSLFPLIFEMCMIPLSLILRKEKVGYEFRGKELKIKHLLFMDDLKLFGKNKEQIDSLVKTVHIVSKDIGMEFGIKKCGMLVMKRGKIVECNGIQLPDEETIKSVKEDGYKYLGILELDKVMEGEMKRKFVKDTGGD